MSIRAIGTRLFRHGQTYVRTFCREYNSNIAETVNIIQEASTRSVQVNQQISPQRFALRNVGFQFSVHARKIFVNNVLSRVTNSLSYDLRKRAARRLLFGDSGPFFALIGVSLASGTGLLTKEEELEGVCWEIRDAVSKLKWDLYNNDSEITERKFEDEPLTVKDLSFDKPIAKGANAVVYAAALKNNPALVEHERSHDNFQIYPLAVKMMFNYDIQSNAMAIIRAMYRETVPARHISNNLEIEPSVSLSSHPNIVDMYTVFTDYVPELPNAKDLYPAALPFRIDPQGEGRNMSLFLVMKRYTCSLQQFLSSNSISPRVSILLFAQLLEAIVHLNNSGIAHRDLKSDNLVLDTSDESVPVLAVTDFGCCLNGKSNGLILPYSSREVDKGGNVALMAPEIITQTPGTFSVLNYSKSDLWAAGTIAYEIFGVCNPFYDGPKLRSVDYKEDDLPNLPAKAPDIIQALVKNILHRNPNERVSPQVAANVLQLLLWAPSSWLKFEGKKPSNTEIMEWLLCLTTKVLCEGRLHKHASTNATEIFEKRSGRRTYPEYLLITSFLRRAKLSHIRSAITWIQDNN